MTILPFIGIATLYIIIGSFIAGIVDDDELTGALVLFWPIIGVVFLIVCIVAIVIEGGEHVGAYFRRYFRKIKERRRK